MTVNAYFSRQYNKYFCVQAGVLVYFPNYFACSFKIDVYLSDK